MENLKTKENQKLILVTGANGYLASNLIKILLEKGYRVRGTVRSLEDKEKYELLYTLVPSKKENLTLVEAELEKPEKWEEAVKGVDWIAHIASPFFARTPKNPQKELIEPALKGVKNVFRAALVNNIKKIVMTSSVAAIGYGKESHNQDEFDETDWSEDPARYYDLSKTLAEKEAWKIYNKNKGKFTLTCINPGLLVGKRLLKNDCPSYDIIRHIFGLPMKPRVKLGIVDVKDAARAHLIALENSEITDGKRYILSDDTVGIDFIIEVMKDNFGRYGYSFAKYYVPFCFFFLYNLFDSENRKFLSRWDHDFEFNNSLSKKELKISYGSWKKAMILMIYEMIESDYIKNKIKNK